MNGLNIKPSIISSSVFSLQWWIQDFSEMGAPTLQGVPTYDFAKISQKLHEIETIWTPGWGGGCAFLMHPKICHCKVYYRLQWSWGKVMFLQVSVILSTGGEYLTRYPPDQVHPPRPGTPPGPVHPLDQVHPPGPGTPPGQVQPPPPGTPPGTDHAGRYGQRVGGTHPTGMQSCMLLFSLQNGEVCCMTADETLFLIPYFCCAG